MPVKFGKSQRKFIKGQIRPSFQYDHEYIKQKSKEELFETINKPNVNRKLRVKCIRELDRRKIKIKWEKKYDSLESVL